MPDWLDPLRTAADAVDEEPAPAPDKRARIIAAALTVLVREGVARLSMRRVAKEAGVALGLAHYYFATKAELLAAAADASRRAAAPAAAEPSGRPDDDLRAVLAANDRGVERLRLLTDLDSQALRDPVVAAAAVRCRQDRDADLVRRLAPIAGFDDAVALGAVLGAAADALAVRALIDPAFDLARAQAVLERLLQAERAAADVPA